MGMWLAIGCCCYLQRCICHLFYFSIANTAPLCRVAAAHYAADDSPKADVMTVTVSTGVSTFRKGDTVKSLVDRADQCLYKAKAAGNNQVVSENAI
jgi:diguanylate cyclase (GGDEF)-like protein